MPNSVTEKKNRTVFYHLIAILIVSIWGATLVNTKVVIQGGMRPDEVFFSTLHYCLPCNVDSII